MPYISMEDWGLLDLESLEKHLAIVVERNRRDENLYATALQDYIDDLRNLGST